jgi:hypothetical protein
VHFNDLLLELLDRMMHRRAGSPLGRAFESKARDLNKRFAKTMKRPKLQDMTEVEEARFRLLQARRAALRVLDRLAHIAVEALSPSSREDYERVRAAAETTIAITDPDWVETAQREQLIQVANHLIDPASAN